MATSATARWLRRILALAAGFCLALTAAELALRLSADELGAYRIWRPGLETVFRPRPGVMAGVGGPSRFRVSSLGFRARERAGEPGLSLLALGGSTTECLYLDQEEAWPALLERSLACATGRSVWVANGGKSGRRTRDHELQLRFLLGQFPRFDTVLLLTGVNDLSTWLAEPGRRSTPPGEPSPAELARAFDVLPLARTPGPPYRRTALWRVLESAHEGWSAKRVQDEAGLVYEEWRAERRSAARWLEELPEASGALADFGAHLAAIDELCRAAAVRLVLVTQPALWRAGLAPELEAWLWLGKGGDGYYTAAALARGLALYNEALRACARERSLPLLDLAAALDGDERCFYDDVHFNEEGARAVAAFLSRELAALGP
jgi:lysophospholipase L1-like esterase